MNPFLGQILMFGGNFAPRGWAFCNGQLLSIAQNQALFSILGTIYGGDGRTSFGLPELRGRVPVHAGGSSGPGLTNRPLGSRGGSQTNTLFSSQLPSHNHGVQLTAEGNVATEANPTNNMLAVPVGGERVYAPDDTAAEVVMNQKSIRQDNVGSNQPVNNMQPYQAVNYIIALQGTFPSRN